ncbi:hypothetical protein ACFE04_012698 [Oxalis oulophora]
MLLPHNFEAFICLDEASTHRQPKYENEKQCADPTAGIQPRGYKKWYNMAKDKTYLMELINGADSSTYCSYCREKQCALKTPSNHDNGSSSKITGSDYMHQKLLGLTERLSDVTGSGQPQNLRYIFKKLRENQFRKPANFLRTQHAKHLQYQSEIIIVNFAIIK